MAICDFDIPDGVGVHELADARLHAAALAEAVAEALNAAIAERGTATLLVSGGRSPIPFLQLLSDAAVAWDKVIVSLADERWVPADHADSNEGLVRRHLLQNRAAGATFVGLYQSADTPEASARMAEEVLSALPLPIDVLVLGMGDDGHTASLFPNSPRLPAAIRPDCADVCLAMQAPSAPIDRLTLTMPTLAAARQQFLAIQGEAKLETLRQALSGEAVEQLPIRAFLRPPLEIYWCP